jgi:hypothetical protein
MMRHCIPDESGTPEIQRGKTNAPARRDSLQFLSVPTRDKVMAKADSIRGTRSMVLMIDDDPSLLRLTRAAVGSERL